MRRLLLPLVVLLGLAVPALAEERVEKFASDVTVNTDASLTVRESITVNAEGFSIKRGILRDFPTTYDDRNGQRMRVGFDVLEVKRDGQPENFVVESVANGKRIKIGNADTFLDYGPHTYAITYRTPRQLGFFDSFDELYWNVTGNGWTMPIQQAEVVVRLPAGAVIQQHAEYTGRDGSTESAASVRQATGQTYSAATTRRLEAGEGFTIAVAWQKGIVAPPTQSQRWNWWLSDNAGIFSLLITLMIAGAYYLYAWNKVGRDPPKGPIVPLFAPPPGIGPAGSRFVWKQGFDNRTFAAALIGLAVSGRARIIDNKDAYIIEKKPDKGTPLTPAERAFYKALPEGRTELKQANNVRVRAMRSALQDSLKGEYEGTVFRRNLGWFWKGALISALGLVISAFLLPAEDGIAGLFVIGWSAIWWGVVLTLGWTAVKGAYQARGILKKLGSLAAMLFILPFGIGGIAASAAFLMDGGSPRLYLLMGGAVLLAIMNMLFFHLLRAPTEPGRKLLDQLEGFRMYMRTAEEDRLNVLNPPEKTPALFERYLPYALALDCENEWNAKFAAVLAAAAAAGATAPLWYSGSRWDSGRTGGFTDSLGSSLASSISSASTAPGSSSGSGGGGSSGGGGGGGGGSGW